jgi:hypothetical protein
MHCCAVLVNANPAWCNGMFTNLQNLNIVFRLHVCFLHKNACAIAGKPSTVPTLILERLCRRSVIISKPVTRCAQQCLASGLLSPGFLELYASMKYLLRFVI